MQNTPFITNRGFLRKVYHLKTEHKKVEQFVYCFARSDSGYAQLTKIAVSIPPALGPCKMNRVLSIGRGSTIGYKEWGAGGKKKILALHGWLGRASRLTCLCTLNNLLYRQCKFVFNTWSVSCGEGVSHSGDRPLRTRTFLPLAAWSLLHTLYTGGARQNGNRSHGMEEMRCGWAQHGSVSVMNSAPLAVWCANCSCTYDCVVG
jgi:hypothetical protein